MDLEKMIIGEWDVAIKTPIGTLPILYAFTENAGGLAGSATGRGETVPLRDITVVNDADGQRITWQQSITKPMRLNLGFDVLVVGDRFTGHSRAGRLPRSTVTGVRRR